MGMQKKYSRKIVVYKQNVSIKEGSSVKDRQFKDRNITKCKVKSCKGVQKSAV